MLTPVLLNSEWWFLTTRDPLKAKAGADSEFMESLWRYLITVPVDVSVLCIRNVERREVSFLHWMFGCRCYGG